MKNIFTPGAKVATVGTFYFAHVVSSEITPRGNIQVLVRWAQTIPGTGVRKGGMSLFVNTPRRTNIILCAS